MILRPVFGCQQIDDLTRGYGTHTRCSLSAGRARSGEFFPGRSVTDRSLRCRNGSSTRCKVLILLLGDLGTPLAHHAGMLAPQPTTIESKASLADSAGARALQTA